MSGTMLLVISRLRSDFFVWNQLKLFRGYFCCNSTRILEHSVLNYPSTPNKINFGNFRILFVGDCFCIQNNKDQYLMKRFKTYLILKLRGTNANQIRRKNVSPPWRISRPGWVELRGQWVKSEFHDVFLSSCLAFFIMKDALRFMNVYVNRDQSKALFSLN